MTMVWHIFRKDFSRLWLLVACVVAAQFANAGFQFVLGNLAEPKGLVTISKAFSAATLFGIAALVIAAVYQDRVPGISQDWLVRPIERRALFIAKIMFVLITVHLPMLMADIAHGLAAGLPLKDVLATALGRNVILFAVLSMPALALATVTTSVVQIIGAVIAIWIVVLSGLAAGIFLRGSASPPIAGTGLQWMTPTYWSVLALLASTIVIPLQYFQRATIRARAVIFGTVLLAPLLSLVPWDSVFAAQQFFSAKTTLANPVVIAFDTRPRELRSEATATDAVFLPLRVSGLPSNAILLDDRADIRIITREGKILFSGRTTPNVGYGDDFLIRTTNHGVVDTYHRIVLPEKVLAGIRDQSVRVEIAYSLTLFRIAATDSIPARNGEKRSGTFGWCKTQVDTDDDGVALGCLTAGPSLHCMSATLENPVNGKKNPENLICEPDYAPYRGQVYPDAISQLGSELHFRDLQQLAHYPVDAAQLSDARVGLRSYEPVAHFGRHLVIPDVRLGKFIRSARTARMDVFEQRKYGLDSGGLERHQRCAQRCA